MRRTLYDDDHEAFRASVRTFVDKEIAPHVDEWSAAGITPRELFTAAGKQGLLGIDVPEEYGGGGVPDFRFNAVLGEELMRTPDAGAGLGIALHNDICVPYFLSYCTEEQKQRWLPGIVVRRAGHGDRHDRARDRLGPRVDDHHARCATATTTSSTAPRPSSPTGSTRTWSSPP